MSSFSRRTKISAVIFLSAFSFLFFSFADNSFEISKNLDIFATLYKEVNTYYVDEVDPAKLMRTGIDAMLNSLDPYTNFYSEAETEDYRIEMTGQYGGVGASIGVKEEYIIITDVYDGYPAQKNDLRAGDMILEIDGKNMKGKSTGDVSKLLKGQPKSKLKIKLRRDSGEELLKDIEREEIHVKNVPYYGMVNEHTGYIKLTGFTNNAGREVRDAMVELKKNEKLTSVILDLRSNPGGLLHEAVNVVNVFVPKGLEVVTTKGKLKDEWNKGYPTLNPPADIVIPLVVLTNRYSASASEIVSGSIQDLDRGLIIGQRTFGKGLVQSTRPLSFNAQLKVTTAKYYIPSGRCIQALDYAHRSEEGNVEVFPDSLKKEFKTKSGRKVYDGGGVAPDVATEPVSLNPVTQSLLGKQILFDYASLYRSRHESIAAARDFRLSDQDFEDFLNFVKGKKYDYETKSEQSLDDFRKKAEEEKYFDAVKDHYEKLKAQLKHDKQADIVKHKAEIIELLEEEITRRYYFQKAKIEAGFDDDREIMAAIKVFADMNQYQSLLKPGSK